MCWSILAFLSFGFRFAAGWAFFFHLLHICRQYLRLPLHYRCFLLHSLLAPPPLRLFLRVAYISEAFWGVVIFLCSKSSECWVFGDFNQLHVRVASAFLLHFQLKAFKSFTVKFFGFRGTLTLSSHRKPFFSLIFRVKVWPVKLLKFCAKIRIYNPIYGDER